EKQALCASPMLSSQKCLLATVSIFVKNCHGKFIQAKAILDSASDINLVSQSFAETLNLPSKKINMKINCVCSAEICSSQSYDMQIFNHSKNWSEKLELVAVPVITGNLPSVNLNVNSLAIPSNIVLADPKFYISSKVDILLGASIFFKCLSEGKIHLGKNLPILTNTIFGWLIAGEVPSFHNQITTDIKSFSACMTSYDCTSQLLQKFWEAETLPENRVLSLEEETCETLFSETTTRNSEGRYIVRLPRKLNAPSLGHSKAQALKRFHSLEARLARDSELRMQYSNFLKVYEDTAQMTILLEETATLSETKNEYFLPHHPVFKPNSSTTKVRVVFDASVKTSNGVSLNDTLAIGPVIQPDLFSQIIKFRFHNIAIISDIQQMYRQVLIHNDDRNFQKIFWRPSSQESIKIYSLNTVTFGTAPASFLAIRTIKQLVLDEGNQFPIASRMLSEDLYVDDLVSGCSTVEEAYIAFQQITCLASRGGFQFKKWASNSQEFLSMIPDDLKEVESSRNFGLSDNLGVHALGLFWQQKQDSLYIQLNIKDFLNIVCFTKRTFLSCISSLYDPIGIISPVIISCKILFQELWLHNLAWDDLLPPVIHDKWIEIFKSLSDLANVSIPRCVCPGFDHKNIQIHGFADSSKSAFGACLYIRTVDNSGKIIVNLLVSKSKVAPVRPISIPRLELSAALLLSKLFSKVNGLLLKHVNKVYLWSDSNVVLAWLKTSPSKLKTYIANRVSEIQ
ncbi:MAG TPA: hypothetical protein VNU45_14220, partial [Rummeliibacillus sp.]|nr:hypothetical protein [Rummeliibacillus sp.]